MYSYDNLHCYTQNAVWHIELIKQNTKFYEMLVVTGNRTRGHWFQPPVLSPLSYDNQTTTSTSQSSIYIYIYTAWVIQSVKNFPLLALVIEVITSYFWGHCEREQTLVTMLLNIVIVMQISYTVNLVAWLLW